MTQSAIVTPAGTTESPVRTPMREFWRKFRKQKLAMWAGVFVVLLVLVTLLNVIANVAEKRLRVK